MPTRRSMLTASLAAALTVAAPIARRTVGERLSVRTERRLNGVADPGPYRTDGAR